MSSINVLIFDLFADYGFVKKNYTTMSPLSFSILPRTVLCGIIGAIIGIDKKKPSQKSEKVNLKNSIIKVDFGHARQHR